MAKRLFYRDKPIFGLDVSATGLKLMAVNTQKWQVTAYGALDLDPAALEHSLKNGDDYFKDSLTELVTKQIKGSLPSNRIAISVPTSYTYSRTMTIPKASDVKIVDAVLLEAEQYIPIPVGELNIDYQILGATETDTSVFISAVPQKIVETITDACFAIGLEPILIEPGISAVARLVTETEEGQLPTAVVDIGAASTDIGILKQIVRVTGSVGVGGNTFTMELSKKMKLSLEAAHQLKVLSGLNKGPRQEKITDALSPSLDKIINEIQKMMRYYTERIDATQKIEQVIIVGGGANLPGIGDYFTNALTMPARTASPWQKLSFNQLPQLPRQLKPRFITSAGIACLPYKEVWKGEARYK